MLGENGVTDSFEVRNSLWHGCTMAPTLFNLYFNGMVSVWCEQCGDIGVPVLHKYGRKLVGDCTAKSRLLTVRISEFQFADDLAFYAVHRIMFESGGRSLFRFSLTVSILKTKGPVMGAINEVIFSPVEVKSGMIEKNFTYLGSNLSSDCEAT